MMRSIFISYSSKQREFVKKSDHVLHGLIKEHKQKVSSIWWDDRLIGGEEWWITICDMIQTHSHFVFLISEESLDSPFCQAELDWANKLKRYIIPVKIDPKVPDNIINAKFGSMQVVRPKSYNSESMLNEVSLGIFNTFVRTQPVELGDELLELIRERPERPLVNKDLQEIKEIIDNPVEMEERSVQLMVLGYMVSMIKYPHKKADSVYLLQKISKMDNLSSRYLEDINDLLRKFEIPHESKFVKYRPKPKSIKTDSIIDIHQVIEIVKAVEPKSPEEYLALSDEILECFDQQNLDDNMLQEIAGKLDIQYKQLTRQKLALELSRKNDLLVKLILVENSQFGNLRGCLISHCIEFISKRNTFQLSPEFS
jgi:hypothetical protein